MVVKNSELKGNLLTRSPNCLIVKIDGNSFCIASCSLVLGIFLLYTLTKSDVNFSKDTSKIGPKQVFQKEAASSDVLMWKEMDALRSSSLMEETEWYLSLD